MLGVGAEQSKAGKLLRDFVIDSRREFVKDSSGDQSVDGACIFAWADGAFVIRIGQTALND